MRVFFISILMAFAVSQELAIVLCEGNFQSSNASLWIHDACGTTEAFSGNPIGDTGQSMLLDGDNLFVVNNGSSELEKYAVSETGLTLLQSQSTNFSGPRYLAKAGETLFMSQWYSSSIAVLNNELEQVAEILVDGLPEYLLVRENVLYASIVMENDWTAANRVLAFDVNSHALLQTWVVGYGPGKMLLSDGAIYLSCHYFDEDWNGHAGVSRIDLSDGSVQIVEHGLTFDFSSEILMLDGQIYQRWGNGICPLNEALQLQTDNCVGNFENLYTAWTGNGRLYFALSDFTAPDQIAVCDYFGNELWRFDVGAIPGDMVFWRNGQTFAGDLNSDGLLDILDIVGIVSQVLGIATLSDLLLCFHDLNFDGNLDVSDIIIVVNQILA